jgi:hypothetical protein
MPADPLDHDRRIEASEATSLNGLDLPPDGAKTIHDRTRRDRACQIRRPKSLEGGYHSAAIRIALGARALRHEHCFKSGRAGFDIQERGT